MSPSVSALLNDSSKRSSCTNCRNKRAAPLVSGRQRCRPIGLTTRSCTWGGARRSVVNSLVHMDSSISDEQTRTSNHTFAKSPYAI
eukprot:5061100-Pyramimonas_sp.AAC.1